MNANRAILTASLVVLLLASTVLALAQGVPGLDRTVVGSGGGRVEAGGVTLDYTIGQPVVGAASAGPYDLCAGFWCAGIEYDIFLPIVLEDA